MIPMKQIEIEHNIFNDYGIEIKLKNKEDFLKVKETLTRIGIASKKGNILYQSCHILHKRGRYAIVHFKELFCLDGKDSDITFEDLSRRNAVSKLLDEWGLIEIIQKDKVNLVEPSLRHTKVLTFDEKQDWVLKEKYRVGKK
jgi:hypothetical protein